MAILNCRAEHLCIKDSREEFFTAKTLVDLLYSVIHLSREEFFHLQTP